MIIQDLTLILVLILQSLAPWQRKGPEWQSKREIITGFYFFVLTYEHTFDKVALIISASEEKKMPTTGEKPGIGKYICLKCGKDVNLDDADDTLPPCPSCNGTKFIRG